MRMLEIREAQVYIPSGHLQFRVAEHTLQTKNVTTVFHVGQCERMAQGMKRATHACDAQFLAKLFEVPECIALVERFACVSVEE